jgi:hypothetical protein
MRNTARRERATGSTMGIERRGRVGRGLRGEMEMRVSDLFNGAIAIPTPKKLSPATPRYPNRVNGVGSRPRTRCVGATDEN